MRRPKVLSLPDFTALADIAWLLLVFFLMSGKMKQADAHPVDLPTSSMFICTLGGPPQLLTFKVEANSRLGVGFSPELQDFIMDELHRSKNLNDSILDPYLLAGGETGFGSESMVFDPSRLENHRGNPMLWVDWLQKMNHRFQVAIRADRNVPYETIHQLLLGLSARRINRISLITNLETDPFASI